MVASKIKLWADLAAAQYFQIMAQPAGEKQKRQSVCLDFLRVIAECCPAMLAPHLVKMHSECFVRLTAEHGRECLQNVIKIFDRVLPVFRRDVLSNDEVTSYSYGSFVIDKSALNDIEFRLMDMCLKQPTTVYISRSC